jgi:hypothetical protein
VKNRTGWGLKKGDPFTPTMATFWSVDGANAQDTDQGGEKSCRGRRDAQKEKSHPETPIEKNRFFKLRFSK